MQELALASWTSEDGLPTNALTDVIQTTSGYLWLGTFEGLARFDGDEFTRFESRQMPMARGFGIRRLYEDPHGMLWLGTQGAGVVTYREGRFESFPAEHRLEHSVYSILVDDQDTVWIGTGNYGAFRFDGSRFVPVDCGELLEVSVRDIIQSQDGAIWFATEGNGLVRMRNGSATHWTVESGLASNAATALLEAADGAIWVGTQEGLSRISQTAGAARSAEDQATWAVESFPRFAELEIHRLAADDYGYLWLATEQGLFRQDGIPGQLDGPLLAGGVPLRSTSALTFDREGALWISSYLAGLSQLQLGKFKNYSFQSGLSRGRVNAVFEAGDGEYLVGGDSGTIHRIRDGEVSQLELRTRLPDVRVRGFLRDSRQRLWIATYGGALRLDGTEEKVYSEATGLPSDQIRFIFEDSLGTIWLGTRNSGLIRLAEDGSFETFDKSSGLSSEFIFSMAETLSGDLLLGTYEGLNILSRDGSVTHYSTADGLAGGIIFNIFVDSEDVAWLSTTGGLSRFQDGELRSLTLEEGLPVKSVFDYAEDDTGFAWLSSTSGLLRVATRQLRDFGAGRRESLEIRVFDQRDGMLGNECTGGAKILKARDGRLWVPTLRGVSVLDPGNLPTNVIAPPVRVKSFLVDGESVDLHGATERHEIVPGKRRFEFDLAALSFLAPSKVRVKYQLVGFDEDWVDAVGDRSVRYTRLPPADYTFRVTAANNDGLWNEEGAAVSFRIQPFLHERPIFRALIGLVLGIALVAGFRWRVRRIRRRNLELNGIIHELKQTEQERELLIAELENRNAEMERFTYAISHDLKSPLITIRGFLGMVERDVASGNVDRMKQDMERIHSATQKMAQLLDELLELSRIGRVVNAPEEVAMSPLAREAAALVFGETAESGAELVIADDLPVVQADRVRLLEVLQNLIANAVKFMGEQSNPRIEVGCRQDAGPAVFFVRDNGSGIEARYHEKVFGLFERLDAQIAGTGIGLALVRRVIEVHGGKIWVESAGHGHGSVFCFTLGGGQSPGSAPKSSSRTSGGT